MKRRVPRILITAPRSKAGKTMITCGILKALKMRRMRIASFKCGPDYIDPMFHKETLGIESYNLDTFLCGHEHVLGLLERHGENVDMAVMEGVMGYYDGLAGNSIQASTYDVADATGTPAVLIVDCKGISVSVVPVIQGFLNYKRDSHIRGVILNRLSPGMYERMKVMIERETSVKVYGYVPVMKDLVLESRYLGLKLPGELACIQENLKKLGEQIEKSVDLDGLIRLAEDAEDTKTADIAWDAEKSCAFEEERYCYHGLRIGIAEDEAFCFIYRDNLDIMKSMGADILSFSPLHDEKLPEHLDGFLFYGGYPELYARQLSENESMRASIWNALKQGVPCIAECGGFMYLQESMETRDGRKFPMVGALVGKSYPTASLCRFGYVILSGGRAFGQDVGEIPAHEFHYYDSECCGSAFTAQKPLSERTWSCMISTDTLLAGYPHIHYGGNLNVVKAFLKACRKRCLQSGE